MLAGLLSLVLGWEDGPLTESLQSLHYVDLFGF